MPGIAHWWNVRDCNREDEFAAYNTELYEAKPNHNGVYDESATFYIISVWYF